jgi:hypothetical protein
VLTGQDARALFASIPTDTPAGARDTGIALLDVASGAPDCAPDA